MREHEQIQAAVASLEAQRATIGDAVVDAAVRPLLGRLAQLRGDPATALQLKQVTVLFADIVGSTALSEQLDNEDAVAITDGALTRFNTAVATHGGRVLRFMGDGLKAIFGADGAEDAPECAVRAGLAIAEQAREHAVAVARQYGVEQFAVRVGINTGQAILGGGVEADNAAMGATASIAARMEHAAPPGSVLISHDTYLHVRGLFDLIEQTPLIVKGRTEALKTYLIERARPRSFMNPTRGIAGIVSPIVGRDAELMRLHAAFAEVEQQRELRALTIIGDAGVGKSRLLHEFQRWLQPRSVHLLPARAYPHSRLQAYSLLLNLFTQRLQISDSDPPDVASGKLIAGIASVLGGEDAGVAPAQVFGHLIGFDFSAVPEVASIGRDARQLRDRAFGVAALWLRRLSEHDDAPVVLLLDDLHWADEGSLAFVQYLLSGSRDWPLMVVMLARRALLERNPEWFADSLHLRIDLSPLDADGSRALASSLLQRLSNTPAELCELITRSAEGNPFYMEELIKMLIDDGVIVVDESDVEGCWQISADKLALAKVPPTLVGVLQARLDALGTRHKSVAQQAAIIGHVFWDQALNRLDAHAPASMATLLQKNFACSREQSAFAASAEFAFQHQLLQQVTYETVAKQLRREGHAHAAAWLIEQMTDAAGGRAGEYSSMAAEHFARAGNRAEAARYFERAATDAKERYANEAALENARRALANVEPDDRAARWRLTHLLEHVFDVMGDRTAQQSTLDELDALATQSGAPEQLANVALGRALLADRQGDFASAIRFARAGIEAAEPAGIYRPAAQCYGEWAYALSRNAQYDAAREKVELGLAHAQRSGDVLVQAQLLAVSAVIEESSHEYAKSIELMTRVVELAHTHGHQRLEGLMQGNVAGVLVALGDYQGARSHAEASITSCHQIGSLSAEANALTALALIELALGENTAALAHARQSVQLTASIGDRYYGARALLALSDAWSANGEPEAAVDACNDARASFELAQLPAEALQAIAQCASLALARGDTVQAKDLVEEILAGIAHGVALTASPEPLKVQLICHRVLAAAGDSRSEQLLRDAYAELQTQSARLADDATRECFVNGIAHHREIVRAYQTLRPREHARAEL